MKPTIRLRAIDKLDMDLGLSKMGVREEDIPYLTENACVLATSPTPDLPTGRT